MDARSSKVNNIEIRMLEQPHSEQKQAKVDLCELIFNGRLGWRNLKYFKA